MKRRLIYAALSLVLLALTSPNTTGTQTGDPNPAQPRGRALLVGINKYQNFPQQPTPGSEEDAVATRDFIRRQYGFRDQEIHLLLGAEATAGRIVSEFRNWLIAGTKPGDRVFFLYSGHGTRVKDEPGGDEEDHEDEALAPYDVDRNGNNLIRDDVFDQMLGELSGRMVVMLFDSCHSGTISRGGIGEGRESQAARADAHPKYLPSPEEFAELAKTGTRSRGGDSTADYAVEPLKREGAGSRDLNMVVDRPQIKNTGIVIFSAAQAWQRAYPIQVAPGKFRGALSYAFNESQQPGQPPPSLHELQRLIAGNIARWQQTGQLYREQQPYFEVICGATGVSLEDQPLFGAAQMAQVLAEGNPGSTIKISVEVDPNKRQFRLGDRISYQVRTNTGGFLYLLVFSSENRATCIFPNNAFPGDNNNQVATETLRVPRSRTEAFVAQPPLGRDVVIALLSKSKLNLGDKEDYTWDEIFDRLGNHHLFEYVKTRGVGTGGKQLLGQTDWQAVSLVLETVQ